MKNFEMTSTPSVKGNDSNLKQITISLATSTVGIVSIFIPKLFIETGIVLGTILLTASSILSFITCLMLCQSAKVYKVGSFPSLCKIILGKQSTIVDFFYALYLVGMIISNHTFVSKSLTGILTHTIFIHVPHDSELELCLTLSVLTIVILVTTPYVTSKDLSSLKKISNYSSFGLFFSLLTILMIFLFPDHFGVHVEPFDLSHLKLFDWNGFQLTTGMFLLAMAVHLIVIDVHSELQPATARNTFSLLANALGVSFVLFLCIAWLGYLTVFQDPEVDQVNNYFLFFLVHKHVDSSWIRLAQVLVTFTFMIGNIFAYIPLIKIFESYLVNNTVNQYKSNELQNLNNTEHIEIKDFEKKPISSTDIEERQLAGETVNSQEVSKIIQTLSSSKGPDTYKNTALGIQVFIIISLFFIIVKNISLIALYNTLSAICYPTICLIFPAIFYMSAKEKVSSLETKDKFISYSIIVIGIASLFFMVSGLSAN
jgi:amino acid permease